MMLRKQAIAPLAVFLIGAVFSLLAFFYVYDHERQRLEYNFIQRSHDRSERFIHEVNMHVEVLYFLKALYAANSSVNREQFHKYTETILLHHPDILSLSWIPRVAGVQREDFEAAGRREGYADFQLTQLDKDNNLEGVSGRREYFPVYFVEPFNENKIIFGFDLASDPNRKATMERAALTESAAATARVKLIRGSANFGCRLFLPVYFNFSEHNTPQDRINDIRGFVSVLFDIGRLMDESFTGLSPAGIDAYLFDSTDAGKAAEFLYFHPSRMRTAPISLESAQAASKGLPQWSAEFGVAGRRWRLVCRPLPELFAPGKFRQAWLVFAACMALAFLLYFYVRELIGRSAKVNALVEQRAAALKESEEKYKTLVENANSIIMRMDSAGKITFFNEFAQEFFGYSRDEVIGKNVVGTIVPENSAEGNSLATMVRDITAQPEKYINNENENMRRSGERVWIAWTNKADYDRNGRISGVLCIGNDITRIKEAQQALKQEKEMAELLYKIVPSAIFTVDKECRVTSWNNKAAELTGYTAEEIMGKPCSVFSDLPCKDECVFVPFAVTGPVTSRECTIVRKDGAVRAILKNIDVIKDKDGKITGAIESFEDITERKGTEEELRKRLRAIEQSPSVVVITDIKGNIEYVNPKFTQLTGYAPADVIGSNVRILKSGKMPSDNYSQLWNTLLGGKEWRGELLNRKKDGELYWESASISAIKSPEGQVEHYLKVSEDITERKHIEEQLNRAYQMTWDILANAPFGIYLVNSEGNVDFVNPAMLAISGATYEQFRRLNVLDLPTYRQIGIDEKIRGCLKGERFLMEAVEYTSYLSHRISVRNFIGIPLVESNQRKALIIVEDISERKRLEKLKDEFVSNVSHELRTPLSIIKEGISLVLDGILGEVNPRQDNVLITAKDNIDRLSRIIDELLDISKIESGKLQLKRSRINLVDLIKRTAAGFEIKIKEKRLDLRMNFSGEEIFVYADVDKITEVFINLLGNAVKFTERGYIEISVQDRKDDVECYVKDSGMGIAEENLPKLFDKFQQFSRVSGPGERGTGLGLSIVKGLIKMHGGTIRAESRVAEGTKFIFTLPKSEEIVL